MRPVALVQRWLFRLGRDVELPIILSQRRIFIVPSAAGLLYAAVLLVMVVGAINYNLSLGHALIFLLAGLGLVGMVHTFNNLFGLRLLPTPCAAVFAGETARFPLLVDNPRQLSRRGLEFAFAGQPVAILDLAPGTSATVAVPFVAARRGRLDPGRITLSTRYPLGLFRAWSYPHPALSCLVYPRPLRTPLPAASAGQPSDSRHGASGQEDFAGLRARQVSDPIRHIAWRAVARRTNDQPLLVKQFAGGASEELWLDWSMTPADADPELRLSILAGWLQIAEERHLPYGLSLPGNHFPPALGDAQRSRCLRALALFDTDDAAGVD